MQALGSYRGGRMLFLGLGTGLGSALIIDGVLEPMELAHLPYKKGRTYEEYVGKAGLARLGKKKWRRHVIDVIEKLGAALETDDVVVGGGNAKLLQELPRGVRLGKNANAFIGGFRLWEHDPEAATRGPSTRRLGRAAGPTRHGALYPRSGAARLRLTSSKQSPDAGTAEVWVSLEGNHGSSAIRARLYV